MNIEQAALIYFVVISLASAVITIYDKFAAKKLPKKRIRENTLMLFGFFGGAEAMYLVMRLIHHKTRHKKFMVGLPAFIVLHIILGIIIVLIRYYYA